MKIHPSFTLAAVLLLPGLSIVAPLVGSTFTDSELGAAGRTTVVTENNSNLTPWWLATSDTSSRFVVVDDNGTGGLGKSGQLSRLEAVLTNFSSVSLLDGQALTLSFNYRYTGDPVSGGEGLRVLLYDSGEAPLPNSDASISSAAVREEYSGYYLSIGTAVATSGSSQTFVRRRAEGNDNPLNSASGTSLIGGGSTLGVASGVSSHLVEITLSRTLDDLNLVISVDGNALINRTDTTPFFDFNTLMISNNTSTSGGNIFVDNIQVNVVPEPATASLIGGGLLLLAARRPWTRLTR